MGGEISTKPVIGEHGSEYVILFEQGKLMTPIVILPIWEVESLINELTESLKYFKQKREEETK